MIVTKSGHPRSADPAQLADLVRKVNPTCPISVQTSLDSALTEALAWAGPDDLICVTGSIFVVAQARRAWAARHPEAFSADDWVFQDETAGRSRAGLRIMSRRWVSDAATLGQLEAFLDYLDREPRPHMSSEWPLMHLLARRRGMRPREVRRPLRASDEEVEILEGNEYPVLACPTPSSSPTW